MYNNIYNRNSNKTVWTVRTVGLKTNISKIKIYFWKYFVIVFIKHILLPNGIY